MINNHNKLNNVYLWSFKFIQFNFDHFPVISCCSVSLLFFILSLISFPFFMLFRFIPLIYATLQFASLDSS